MTESATLDAPTTGPPGRAFVILLDGPEGERVAQMMADHRNDKVDHPAQILMHPSGFSGMRYLAASGDEATALDKDWAASVDPETEQGVFVMVYEPGLENYLGGLDAEFVIGFPDSRARALCEAAVEERSRLHGIQSIDPEVIGKFAMVCLAQKTRQLFNFVGPITEASLLSDEALELDAEAPAMDLAGSVQAEIEGAGFEPSRLELPPNIAAYPVLPPPEGSASQMTRLEAEELPELAEAQVAEELPPMVPPKDSFLGYLSRAKLPAVPEMDRVPMVPEPPPRSHTKVVPAGVATGGSRLSLLQSLALPVFQRITGRPEEVRIKVDPAYATKLGLLRGVCVAVGNPKGGAGKTATTIGVGAVIGLLENLQGHMAAVLDANLGNESSWSTAGIRQDRCSVTQLVESLNRGEVPPAPAFANTPGLAIYREEAGRGGGYTADELGRGKDYILNSHGALIADLSNRLPDTGSKEGEVVLHWMQLADVFVVPIDSDEDTIVQANRFIDAIDQMVVARGPGARPVPVVVAYLAVSDRAVRRMASLQGDLDQLAQRVQAIVEVPRDDRYYMAQRLGRPITEVSKGLTKAYTEVAEAVIDAALLARQVAP